MTKILIVDDDKYVSSMLVQILEEFNYHVLKAENSSTVLDLAIKELPDLIISDLEMPVIDGIMLFELIKGHPLTNNIPFILMSGAFSTYSDKIKESNIKFFLNKPFSIEDLKKLINNIGIVR